MWRLGGHHQEQFTTEAGNVWTRVWPRLPRKEKEDVLVRVVCCEKQSSDLRGFTQKLSSCFRKAHSGSYWSGGLCWALFFQQRCRDLSFFHPVVASGLEVLHQVTCQQTWERDRGEDGLANFRVKPGRCKHHFCPYPIGQKKSHSPT